jgi:L-seryl-tRNA(Ser) seleniumtransferase
MKPTSDGRGEALRLLPSVETVLQDPRMVEVARAMSREFAIEIVRDVLEGWRAEIRRGELDAAGVERRFAQGGIGKALVERIEREQRAGLRRAVNATGVVLHTGLGRAPVHVEAARAMGEVAGSYCILEVDRESGERNERDERLSVLLQRACGAEAGIAVNNNAAAVYLVLNTFATGVAREVIVSRGELVEIGGSFRIPDVMERAGVVLREVGTTNRTRAEDFRRAICERTALLMKVHTSNFRVEGFVEDVSASEIAAVAAEKHLPSAFDLGSGLLEVAGMQPLDMLGPEPRVRAALESGVDVVTFSGDKLLGAPQAGLIVGKRAAIAALRKNPVYRALRLDKVAIAGLERTLELVLAGRGDEVPARRMMLASAGELRPRAESLARAIAGLAGFSASVESGQSQPGSGSAPGIFLPTFVVRLKHANHSAAKLAQRLRSAEPPVFTRVQDDAVLLDPRTLLDGDDERLLGALKQVSR